jgi:subtilisin-like proprotein convertase family protein
MWNLMLRFFFLVWNYNRKEYDVSEIAGNESLKGDWQLFAIDYAAHDKGFIESWNLDITYNPLKGESIILGMKGQM